MPISDKTVISALINMYVLACRIDPHGGGSS